MNASRLLVSVRNAAEAVEALAGGADLIDIKDPARGALGAANPAVWREILAAVAGRVPVSAALGEFRELPESLSVPPELDFVKVGLSGCAGTDWSGRLKHLASRMRSRLVAVIYADWLRAGAPAPETVLDWAEECGTRIVLVDTWDKSGPGLPGWMEHAVLAALLARCRAGGRQVALAGSLGLAEIAAWPAQAPDWWAVRGAACQGGRGGRVERGRVRALAQVIRAGPPGDPQSLAVAAGGKTM